MSMKTLGRWLIAGEGAKIRAILGRDPIVPSAWYTPEWLHHSAGNAMLIGFYMPAIAFCCFLVGR